MSKILVNFIFHKSQNKFTLLDHSQVLADLPIAILDTEEDINEPLVVPIQGSPTVVDKAKYESINKQFFLVTTDDGTLIENPHGTPVWLPKDTDLSKLKFINGQIVMIDTDDVKDENEIKEK